MATHIGWKAALTAALGKVADTTAVDQITLTAPLALTVPAGFPAGQVYRATLTQDGTGGHTVTYGGTVLDVAATGSTAVELQPDGAGGRTVSHPLRLPRLVSPEQFGAKGDGIADDAAALASAMQSGRTVLMAPGKTYGIGAVLTVDAATNLHVVAHGATIKLIPSGTGGSEVGNVGIMQFTNCANLTIEGLTVDSNVQWMARPPLNDPDRPTYLTRRLNSYQGLAIRTSTNVHLSQVTAQNCAAGFFLSGVTYATADGCRSIQTLADGFIVAGASKHVHVSNHSAYRVEDDTYTAAGYSADITQNPQHVQFTNCTALDCFGALTCLEGTTYTGIADSQSYNNRYSPIKLGHMVLADGTWADGHHQTVANCHVVTNDPDPSTGTQPTRLEFILSKSATDYAHDLSIDGCRFEVTSTTQKLMYALNARDVTIRNSYIRSSLAMNNVVGLTIDGCHLITQEVISLSGVRSVIVKGSKIDAGHTYGASVRALTMSNKTDSDQFNVTIVGNDITNQTADASGIYYPVSLYITSAVKNVALDSPTLIGGNGAAYSGIDYRGTYPSVGYTLPNVAYFKRGQLAVDSAGLKAAGATAWQLINALT